MVGNNYEGLVGICLKTSPQRTNKDCYVFFKTEIWIQEENMQSDSFIF